VVLEKSGNLYGERTAAYIMPPQRSVNIDSLPDIWLAEYFLTHS
jgi:CMP-N-acetylneuraminic acid synthetase